jgi:hypothetical protein
MSSTIAPLSPDVSLSVPTKWKLWLGRGLSGLVAFGMLASATMKLTGAPQVVEMFTGKFGYPAGLLPVLAALEITSVALYLIPQTAVLGAIIVAGYLGGAVATHVRVGDAFIAPLLLGIIAWAGLYLRDQRLHALLPLRRL